MPLMKKDELLWGTDPDNPDSDGDWTRDGDEVDRGYDPADAASHPPRPPSSGRFAGGDNMPAALAAFLIALVLLCAARSKRARLGE